MAETGFGCKQNDQQLILAITKLIATLQHTTCHKGIRYHVLWKWKKRGQVVMDGRVPEKSNVSVGQDKKGEKYGFFREKQ